MPTASYTPLRTLTKGEEATSDAVCAALQDTTPLFSFEGFVSRTGRRVVVTPPDSGYSENVLVERPAIELFARLGYETANSFYEHVGGAAPTLGRETTGDVILRPGSGLPWSGSTPAWSVRSSTGRSRSCPETEGP